MTRFVIVVAPGTSAARLIADAMLVAVRNPEVTEIVFDGTHFCDDAPEGDVKPFFEDASIILSKFESFPSLDRLARERIERIEFLAKDHGVVVSYLDGREGIKVARKVKAERARPSYLAHDPSKDHRRTHKRKGKRP